MDPTDAGAGSWEGTIPIAARRFLIAATALLFAAAATGCEECGEISGHTLDASPNPALAGDPVQFTVDYRLNGKPVGKTLKESRFDLDGDGKFETIAETNEPRATRTYAEPATVDISHLGVAWFAGLLGGTFTDASVVTRTVEIVPRELDGPQPPLAAFTATPNPANVEQDIVLDASGSGDPDGQVVRYEWDLDNDGAYERDTGATPTTKTAYIDAGEYVVGLRVTDDDGASATTTRTIVVHDPTLRVSPARIERRLADAQSFGVSFRGSQITAGKFLLNGDELIALGAKATGRISPDAFPAALRHGERRVRIAAAFDVATDLVTGDAKAEGVALLRFPAGGRACLGFRVDAPSGAEPSGSYRVAGGTAGAGGHADRLRGAGTADAEIDSRRVDVTAEANFRLGRERSFRLGRSDCGPLRRFLQSSA